MNVIGIPSFTKLITKSAGITRGLHVFALYVVVQVGGLGHVTADGTLPLSTA